MDDPSLNATLPSTGIAPVPADPLIGTVLDDRYVVLGRLGEGGMGLVYEAKHKVLGNVVAIKLLRDDAAADREALERLKREAQSASAIGNPHIVEVRDFGRTPDGTVYVAMERIDGVDLFKLLQKGPLGWARATRIGIQVAEALGAAHERGIVHRDLKAENVLLCVKNGEADFVKVVDFGIAQIEGSEKITVAGRVMGTPAYMSPEQCAGKPVDHRTDIYSLGVLLYEMVTGRVPFPSPDLVEVVRAHLHTPPAAPSAVRPDAEIPLALEAVILRCLAKPRGDRFASMAEVGAALAALDPSEVAIGAPPSDAAIARPPRATTDPALDPATTGRVAPAAPRRGLLVGGAVAFVAACAVAGAVLATGGEAPADPDGPTVTASPPPPLTAEPAAPAAAAPAPAPDPALPEAITLRSTPEGAEVYEGDALLGTTPLRVARPEGDARTRLEVRADGYAPHAVVLSALTAADLAVALEAPAARVRPVAAPSPAAATPTSAPRPRAPAPAPTPAPTKHREFRDPWQ